MCHPPTSVPLDLHQPSHPQLTQFWRSSSNLCSARHNYHFHFSQHTTYTLRSTLATPFNSVCHLADWGQKTNHSWRRKAEKDNQRGARPSKPNPTETEAVDCHRNGRRRRRRATRWGEQGEVLTCIIFSSSFWFLTNLCSGPSSLLGPHRLPCQGRLLWGSVFQIVAIFFGTNWVRYVGNILHNICCCRDASLARRGGEAGRSGQL